MPPYIHPVTCVLVSTRASLAMTATVRPPVGADVESVLPSSASLHAMSTAVPSNVRLGRPSVGVSDSRGDDPLMPTTHRKLAPDVALGSDSVCSTAPLVGDTSSTNSCAYTPICVATPSPARTRRSDPGWNALTRLEGVGVGEAVPVLLPVHVGLVESVGVAVCVVLGVGVPVADCVSVPVLLGDAVLVALPVCDGVVPKEMDALVVLVAVIDGVVV